MHLFKNWALPWWCFSIEATGMTAVPALFTSMLCTPGNTKEQAAVQRDDLLEEYKHLMVRWSALDSRGTVCGLPGSNPQYTYLKILVFTGQFEQHETVYPDYVIHSLAHSRCSINTNFLLPVYSFLRQNSSLPLLAHKNEMSALWKYWEGSFCPFPPLYSSPREEERLIQFEGSISSRAPWVHMELLYMWDKRSPLPWGSQPSDHRAWRTAGISMQ